MSAYDLSLPPSWIMASCPGAGGLPLPRARGRLPSAHSFHAAHEPDGRCAEPCSSAGAAIGYLIAGSLSLTAMGIGGLIAGLSVALLAGAVSRMTVLQEDASFASFYLISLAVGVLIVSLRGSNIDLLHVLFGTNPCHRQRCADADRHHHLADAAGARRALPPLVIDCFDPGFLRAVGGRGPLIHGLFMLMVVLNLVAASRRSAR